jgi:hypothetical protein
LHTLLGKGANETKLLKAAEVVRDARIQVLRARLGELPLAETPEQQRRTARLDAQIKSLHATTPAAVLTEFTSKKPKENETN